MVNRRFVARRPQRRARPPRVAVPVAPAGRETAPSRVLEVPPAIVVHALADAMGTDSVEVIKQLMRLGVMATINNVLDFETAATVATTMGYRVRRQEAPAASGGAQAPESDGALRELQPRAPVVTILGHVDHGKTTLLDAIRKTNLAAQEVGGITQHIGAYQVEYRGHRITFLDTPGHEAFTAMRARGAQATDIAILVVAADDGVMPQTREAVDHAKAAKVPIVVAINKMDRPGADPERVKRQLMELGLVPEEWGGDTIMVPVAAKPGTGIDDLLENLLVVAEVEELGADPNRPASGVVIEARLDKSKGPMATVLVQQGTLRVGDAMVVGYTWGRIKAMIADTGRRVRQAPPATPVEVLGLGQPPEAGDPFQVVEDEKTARVAVEQRRRQMDLRHTGTLSLVEVATRIQAGEVKELPVILKCDVQGSIEPVRSALAKVASDKAQVQIIHAGAGTVTESDILLATASQAVVVGFNTRVEPGARSLAEQRGVEVRLYDIIYRLSEDVERALQGLLKPEEREVIDGRALLRTVFSVGRRGRIAGCQVTEGKLARSSRLRVIRNGQAVFAGGIASLKRFKDDVRDVAAGLECGVGIEGFTDLQEGDILESFHVERG